MKKILLLAAAALMVTAANAHNFPTKSIKAATPARPHVEMIKQQAQMKVAEQAVPGSTPVVRAPKKAGYVDLWYRRPAGAFTGTIAVEDGAYGGAYYAPYVFVKPYVDYTFNGYAVGQSPDATFEWDVQYWDFNNPDAEEPVWETVPGMDLTWQWGYEAVDAPVFYCMDGEDLYMWNMRGFKMGGTAQKPVIDTEYSANIASVPSTMDAWDVEILKSSKTFCYGGRNGDQYYLMTYYSGAEPYGNNENGWWFGKNAGTSRGNRIDGIAQAFEKPTAPYKLKQVVLDCGVLEVAGQVDMTCKIYKLDEIPAYDDSLGVALPDEPGELLYTGRATLTPETAATTGDLVFFDLYGEEDGLEFNVTPTIDCAILVVIDGYNEPEMDNLTDFSALICSDMHTDEGYGELAYLKYGVNDEDGNLDHYVWAGLNRFFGGDDNEMKTGLSIFLTTENPYLKFYFDEEDGKYEFPKEGGKFEKTFEGDTFDAIVFESWVPSADDAWYVTVNDEDVPDWLNIQLEDYNNEAGEFTGVVFASVEAQPLPAGMKGREAVVRFEFDGAYVDYTFTQGEPTGGLTGDVNGDGSVNIADVNLVIDMILSGTFDATGDINGDGTVNISDINALIAIILK